MKQKSDGAFSFGFGGGFKRLVDFAFALQIAFAALGYAEKPKAFFLGFQKIFSRTADGGV